MSADTQFTDVTGFGIPYLRLDEFFVVKPIDGKIWLQDAPLPGRYTVFGQCKCGSHCYCYVMNADSESGMPAHTVIRCSGDYGCKARVVIPHACHTYGELELVSPFFKDNLKHVVAKETEKQVDFSFNDGC